MKKRWIAITSTTLLIGIPFVVFNQTTTPQQERSAQEVTPRPLYQPPPYPRPTPKYDLETSNRKQLTELLDGTGIYIEEARPIRLADDAAEASFRSLWIRWSIANPNAPDFIEIPEHARGGALNSREGLGANRVMKVIERRIGKGKLSQPRSLDLTSQEILVVAIDGGNNLRYWNIVPDYRLVREEPGPPHSENPTGRERIFHQPRVEFAVDIPDDTTITEIRFYYPSWTGSGYELELLSTIDVRV